MIEKTRGLAMDAASESRLGYLRRAWGCSGSAVVRRCLKMITEGQMKAVRKSGRANEEDNGGETDGDNG
ncbi:hypothetical protein HQ563_02955 [bacterium]|nr:hypothetical protein [bacterium]